MARHPAALRPGSRWPSLLWEKDMKCESGIWSLLLPLSGAACALAGAGGFVAGMSPEGPLAIRGYDPVAYFQEGRPVKGSPSFVFGWHGMNWQFLNEDNRELFAASPQYYAPQYDGYCAWAMTESRKAESDPEVWKIVAGKLYLNCSMAAYEKWSRDIPGHIRNADTNWRKWEPR
jgi:hypothetical protein